MRSEENRMKEMEGTRVQGFGEHPTPKTWVSKPNLTPYINGDLSFMFGFEFRSKLVLKRPKNQRKTEVVSAVRAGTCLQSLKVVGSESVIFSGLFCSVFRILGRFCNFCQMSKITISAHFCHFLQGKNYNNIIPFIPKINHLR